MLEEPESPKSKRNYAQTRRFAAQTVRYVSFNGVSDSSSTSKPLSIYAPTDLSTLAGLVTGNGSDELNGGA